MVRVLKIVGLGGSLRSRSYSLTALEAALEMAEELGALTEILDVRSLRLPMFVPEQRLGEYSRADRPSIERLVRGFRDADAMLWSSPTYHGTVSGVVKNALDFAEMLRRDDPPYLQGRAVGLITTPDPSSFCAMAASVRELRAWLAPTRVLVGPEDFDARLTMVGDQARSRTRRLVRQLMDFAGGLGRDSAG